MTGLCFLKGRICRIGLSPIFLSANVEENVRVSFSRGQTEGQTEALASSQRLSSLSSQTFAQSRGHYKDTVKLLWRNVRHRRSRPAGLPDFMVQYGYGDQALCSY